MEKAKGFEIRYLPFNEVALDQQTALQILTQRTKDAFVDNINFKLSHLDPQQSNYPQLKEVMTETRDNVENEIPPGGISFTEQELDFVYSEMGGVSYYKIIGMFIEEEFPKFLNQEEQEGSINPATICVGYLLDLLKIVNPKVANFDDGVKIIIQAMRHGHYQLKPFLLGAMVDDASHQDKDFLVAINEVKQFKESYLRWADEEEKASFQAGINIPYSDIFLAATGFSPN